MFKRIRDHVRSPRFLRNLLLCILISVLSGHLVVTHGRDYELLVVMADPRYWKSVAYSGFIAFILIQYIYWVSRGIARKFAGRGLTLDWIVAQGLRGVVVTILLELVLATVLFWVNGIWIGDSAFFDKLFIPICMFVVMVNLFLIVYYLQRDPLVNLQVRYKLIESKPALAVEGQREDEELAALVFVLGGQCWCQDFSGRETFWPGSFDNKVSGLPEGLYFQGHRNWAIHRDAIVEVKNIAGRRIRLEVPFEGRLVLVVSRRRAAAFKRWLSNEC